MEKSRLWGRLGPSGVSQQKGVRGVCSVEEFQSILHNEQDRASRSQHEFSLLLFNINGTESGRVQFEDLVKTLTARIRSTDEVGWLDRRYLGVILPYTPAVGAEQLAADICRACSATGVPLSYIVYTYPSKWTHDNNGDRRQYYFTDISPGWAVVESPDSCASERDVFGTSIDFTACSHSARWPVLRWESQVPAQMRPNCRAWAPTRRLFGGGPLPIWKRAMDIVVAAGGLVLLSPLILFISLVIKSVSPGPVFFKQNRIGHMGKPFTMWKFRTMKVNSDPSNHKEYVTRLINGAAENGDAFGKPMTKLDDDPRVIPFGKIIRKTCLDELPQLVNVLRGQMSLVGPRPAIDYEVQVYSSWHHRRLDTVPGVTGLWQVNGKNRLTFNQMVRLDIKYLKERSFLLDMSILLRTPFAVLSQIKDSLQPRTNCPPARVLSLARAETSGVASISAGGVENA